VVVVIPEFLSPDDCDAAAACFPSARAAAVDHGAGIAVDDRLRRSRASFLVDASGHALVKRVRELMLDVNRRRFKLDLFDIEPLQLSEYAVGDGYKDHLDIGPGPAALRKLSASVQLTDPSAYDGGDLHIWGTGKVERTRGAIILFESYLVHRVEPVTRGLRRSLVAWATGMTPYR
jgi:PKHD-type hydroxylase